MQLATAKGDNAPLIVQFLSGEEVMLPAAEWVPTTASEEGVVDLKAALIKHCSLEGAASSYGATAELGASTKLDEFELVLMDEDEVPLPAAPACFAGHGAAIARDAETGCTVCSVMSAELFVRMVARGAEFTALVDWREEQGAGAGGSDAGEVGECGAAAGSGLAAPAPDATQKKASPSRLNEHI